MLSALKGEMQRAARQYGRLKFDTVYFGGGTPSVLATHEMTELMDRIRADFEVAKDAEITCEWNPGDGPPDEAGRASSCFSGGDDEKLSAFKTLGVNRISLGAQSFRDALLTRLGRRHTVHDTILTIERIRRAGIGNISVDLMLRIPGQTPEDFQVSLDRAVELGASQVSLYDLEVHDGTVFGREREENKLELPGEEEHAAMYRDAIDTLTRASYEHYEISNFAKPGFASRHNLIYWHNQEYLGIGPGAFSYLNGIRYQFASDADRTRASGSCRGSADALVIGAENYLRKCEAGDTKNDVQDELSEEEKETESFVTGLRLREGVRPEEFSRIYPGVKDRVEELAGEELLEWADGRVRLTDRGKFLSEEVFGFLLRRKEGC
jgi:oxygen-independent coproporphyrinogen-3 oxidase